MGDLLQVSQCRSATLTSGSWTLEKLLPGLKVLGITITIFFCFKSCRSVGEHGCVMVNFMSTAPSELVPHPQVGNLRFLVFRNQGEVLRRLRLKQIWRENTTLL
jgi:hypothetical protein